MAQRKRIQLGTMRLQVQSLASFSELRIWRCCELWGRSQTWLRSDLALAVAQAGSYSSDSTPSLGTSICHECGLKKQKQTNKCTKKKIEIYSLMFLEFRSLKLGCQEVHTPCGLWGRTSLDSLLYGTILTFLGLPGHQSLSLSSPGLLPCVSLCLFTWPSYGDTSHWI